MSISNPPFQSTLVDADGRTQTPWVQWFSQLQPLLNSVNSSGPTSARPTSGLYIGYAYFDTTINQMIYWSGVTWIVNAPSTSGTSILKGNGTGGFNNAISGIDFAPATTGAAILFGNNAGGFNSVAIGTGVTFVGGVLSATGTGGTVTAVTGISPILSSGGITPAISIPVATTLISGYLSSTDWTTFNNKGTVTSVAGTGSVNGITLTGTVTSSGSLTLGGTLGSIANSQLTNSSITINGNLVSLGGSTTVTATATNALTIGTGLSGTSYNGSTAVTIANTGVLSVSATAPVASSGGANPDISMASATTSVNGYLTSTDWTTFNNKQNAFGSQTANYVYAAPNGSAGAPSFRALVSADIPSLSGTYIPYTGASSAVDLNAKTLVNVANLGVNTSSVLTIRIRAVGDNNSSSRIAMRGYSSNASSSSIRVSKFRGTELAPQAPISGDSLGKFELAGYGTTSADAYPQVSLEGVTTEVWSAIARGAKAVIKVTPNTTITQVTALTIDQDKSVTLAGALSVTGTTTLATSLSGLAKLTAGVVSTATSGTDYAPATSGSSILYGNAAGGFSNVTIGSGVSFAAGTLSATGSGGTVTSVTGTAPVVSSGGTTPAISMAAATSLVNGYLTSTDWTTFNNKQPAGTYLTASTGVTTFAGNSTGLTPATATSGAITLAGILVGANGGTGVANTGKTITLGGNFTTSGAFTTTLTVTANTSLTLPISGTVLSSVTAPAANPITGTPSASNYLRGDGTWATIAVGTGTVTSVAATVPTFLSISGSPITTSGTLAITLSGTALPVANGGTGLTTLTAGYIPYGNGTGALSSSSILQFDGSNLLINTPTAGGKLTVYNSGSGNIGAYSLQNTSSIPYVADMRNASTDAFRINWYGTPIGSISVNSGGVGVLYNITSDQRLKENIISAPDASADIDAIQIRSFNFLADINKTQVKYGFIAQELILIAPDAVHQPENSNDMMGVDYSKLVPMMIKEIQSLRARLNAAGL